MPRLAFLLAIALALAACKPKAPDPDAPTVTAEAAIAESSCFWNGPWVREDPVRSYAFPDDGAAYWATRFTLPEGASIVLEGEFAHARYTSFVIYDGEGKPTDSITDYQIEPDKGSNNPFRVGNSRAARPRHYRVTLVEGPPPAQRAPNHVYVTVGKNRSVAVLYRVYVPDRNLGRTAGVPLPTASLVSANGQVTPPAETCTAIAANHDPMPNTVPPPGVYKIARDRPLQPSTYPAEARPQWHAFYDAKQEAACIYFKRCDGEARREGGVFSNPDNAYLSMMINRGFGPVFVLRGKLPEIPATRDHGGDRMREGDLRYWSLCNYETYTQKVMGCVYDELLPLDAQRNYTIAISRPEDRPANAKPECGIAWVEWLPTGDGAGHPDDGMLFLRNMLPAPGFANAVQRTSKPGDERAVMGSYMPEGEYSDVAGFEKLGCKVRGSPESHT